MRLIDADELILRLETQDNSCAPDTLEDWTPQDMTRAEIADINKMPTIDATPVKHGEWIKGQFVDSGLKCPFCGFVPYDPGGCEKFNYCSNCGAKMDGERKDDEHSD